MRIWIQVHDNLIRIQNNYYGPKTEENTVLSSTLRVLCVLHTRNSTQLRASALHVLFHFTREEKRDFRRNFNLRLLRG
jgi:hypothetical protein